MKKTLSFLALVPFIALLIYSPVIVAQAASISVGVYDKLGNSRDTFNIGEDIRVIASSSNEPITIVISDPDGVIIYTEVYNGYTYDKTLSGLTLKLGWYTVEASSPLNSKKINYACTYFNVVPEIPTGTIGVATVFLLSMGFYGLMKRKGLYTNIK
jgi:hypothetical protein